MDRKVIKKRLKHHHLDKPTHQRWLYKLSDVGLFKAMLIIWGVCLVAIAGALLLVKAVLSGFK